MNFKPKVVHKSVEYQWAGNRGAAVQKHWTLVAQAYNLIMLHSAGRRCRSFRAKLEAYKDSVSQQETIHCFEQIATAH